MEQMAASAGVLVKGVLTVACDTCGTSKVTEKVWKNRQIPRSEQPFGHVVVDIIFYPNPTLTTPKGHGPLIHLTCVNTHVRLAASIASKGGEELLAFLKATQQQVLNKYGVSLAWIQCDNERGLMGSNVVKRLEAMGLHMITTSRDTIREPSRA
jgi:hypothetical protein